MTLVSNNMVDVVLQYRKACASVSVKIRVLLDIISSQIIASSLSVVYGLKMWE